MTDETTRETSETVETRTERAKRTDAPDEELETGTQPAPTIENAEAVEITGDEPTADA